MLNFQNGDKNQKSSKKRMKLSLPKRNNIYKIIIILAISLAAEIFICNFRYFQTHGNVGIQGLDIQYSAGIVKQEDGTFYLNPDDNCQIEINNIEQELQNIRIDITKVSVRNDANEAKYQTLPLFLRARDEANGCYYSLPERTVVKYNERSKCIPLNLSGVVSSLVIDLNSSKECYININDIALNVEIPFEFTFLRFIGIFILCTCIWLICNVNMYKGVIINLKSPIQNIITVIILVSQLIMWWHLGDSNPYFTNTNDRQYYDLVEAIEAGQAYVDVEVDPRLAEMDNPYDNEMRRQLGVAYKWDYAYFEGKYYIYFGVVPALLVYLPFYKITGEHIPNNQVVLIGIVCTAVLLMLLLRKLAEKYAPKLPLLILYAMYLVSSNAIGCAFMVSRPGFYSVPIIYGLLFMLGGLYLWFCAADNAGIKRIIQIASGALCMALVAGCRPQFLLSSFLFIPIIGFDWIEKWKKKEKKQIYKEAVATAIPYLIIGIGLMYYNYIRFGSCFDFGANYNITTNDVIHRGWKLDRVGLGIFAYLFNPVRLKSVFPFIDNININTAYQGRTISESLFGGAFSICPFLVTGVYVLFYPKLYSEKKSYIFHVMNVIFAVLIVVADTQMGGMLYRYMSDFMIFLILPSCMAVMRTINGMDDSSHNMHLIRFFMFVMLYSLLLYHMLYFSEEIHDLKHMDPIMYYKISNAVQFWI